MFNLCSLGLHCTSILNQSDELQHLYYLLVISSWMDWFSY